MFYNKNNILDSSEFINIFKFQSLINNNGKKFLNNTQKENLFGKKIKISIIIYCIESKYIDKTIYSIVNQNFDNYEIIIIYDNYDIFDYNYIPNISKRNIKNIQIINNNDIKGMMYSYSIGVLKSIGDYILILQSGFTLAQENILSSLYNNSINLNADILEFNLLINNNIEIKNNNLILYKCMHYKSDIDLKEIKNNKNFRQIDQEKELLFNKLIKSEIYKKIIYKYKLHENNITLYNYYDDIIIFLLNKSKINFKKILMQL